MTIGINASAAFKPQRTGVEEYTYQLLKHLSRLDVDKHQVVLYVNKADIDTFGFKARKLIFPFMWTQLRLGLEMLVHKPDILFIPVHVLPLVHPRKSIVTIHGLEYEYFPEMYPASFLRYLRFSTKYALKHAYKIIAVSNNTKRDLVRLYGGDSGKIEVVYHGVNKNPIPTGRQEKSKIKNKKQKNENILYLGRLEKKKNVDRLAKAFNILKQKYKIPHKLILAGPAGYRFEEIERVIKSSKSGDDIVVTGYVSEEEKYKLLENTDEFVFPSLYEGFGMPILEAQSVGAPVVTSNISSLEEIVGESALKVNPLDVEQIAESIYKVINDDKLRKNLIKQGYENAKRFSWEKCAKETLDILINS